LVLFFLSFFKSGNKWRESKISKLFRTKIYLELVKNEILSKQLKNNLKDDGLLQSEMDFVLNSLNQNSLVCSEFEPLENLEDEFFREEYYQFRASGDFKNVVSFLTDLQNFGGSIKFKDVQFVRIGKDKISIVAKLGIVKLYGRHSRWSKIKPF